MKKYEVKITFSNGQKYDFETNSDVRSLNPIEVNGARMIMTEEEIGININHVEDMKVIERI